MGRFLGGAWVCSWRHFLGSFWMGIGFGIGEVGCWGVSGLRLRLGVFDPHLWLQEEFGAPCCGC